MALLNDSYWSDLGLIIVLLFISLYIYLKYHYSYWARKGIDYIKPSLLFGNFDGVAYKNKNPIVATKEFYEHFKGPFGGVFFITQPTLLIKDKELVKDILIKDFNSFHDRNLYLNEEHDILTGNLLGLRGERWKKLRNMLSPVFTSGKLKQMAQIILGIGDRLQDHLDKVATSGDNVFGARELMSRYTTENITSTAFGVEIDSINNPKEPFREIGKSLSEPKGLQFLKQMIAFTAPDLANLLKINAFGKKNADFLRSVTKQSVELRESNKVVRQDFMQLLVQIRNGGKITNDENSWNIHAVNELSKKLSIDEMTAQVFLFFFGGFDSSSAATSHALFEIAKNKTIQKKLQADIDEALQRHNNEWNYETIQDMPYLSRVLDETLRKHPSIGVLMRTASRDYKIPNSNVVIDKGTNIVISTYGMQHDPKYFKDPMVFDPERFTAEAKAAREPFTYLPFGDGPRSCLGMRFGLLQSKIGLAKILVKFDLDLAPGTSPELNFVGAGFHAEGGVRLTCTRRK